MRKIKIFSGSYVSVQNEINHFFKTEQPRDIELTQSSCGIDGLVISIIYFERIVSNSSIDYQPNGQRDPKTQL